MTLYVESSAVLAWLLGEPRAHEVRQALSSASVVVTSDFTLIECDRVLIRASALGDLSEAETAARRAELTSASAHWTVLRIAAEVVDRARRPFPLEPVRTLDALHLACALAAKAAAADVVVLSLDDQIRKNARALGLDVRPADGQSEQPAPTD